MSTDPIVARAVLRNLAQGEALEAEADGQLVTHLRANAVTGRFECRHCHAVREVPDTVGVEDWLRESHDFIVRHRGCPAPRGVA